MDGRKNLKDACRRWIAEIVFSASKEYLERISYQRRFSAQKIEAGLKIMLYNKYMGL